MDCGRLVCAGLVLLCLAAPADRAQAKSSVLDLTTDPALGTIHDTADVSLHIGQVWVSAEIPFAPITLNQGDDVTVNVTFSGGNSLGLQSGDFFSGNEELAFILHPLAPGTTIDESSVLTSLTVVSGTLVEMLPFTGSGTAVGQISGDVTRDMTIVSFAFSGFTIHTTFTSLTGGPVMLSSAQLLAAANNVATFADRDGDGLPDVSDNCPDVANPGQEDTGGIGVGSPKDGIGDACQCGDVNGDGRVTLVDAVMVQRSLLQPPTAILTKPELCDVGASSGCTLADAVIIRRALLAPPTATIQQVCAPANP